MDPIPESPSARQPVEESTAPSARIGGDERLASMADGLAAAPEAMAGTAGSSGAEAGVANVVLESRVEKPMVLEG